MQDIINWIQKSVAGDYLRSFAVAALIVLVTHAVSRIATKIIRKVLSSDGVPLPSSSILINIVRVVAWAIGLSTMLSSCFGVDVNGLVTALGVGGIALSLGFQDTISNFIGGLQVTLMKIVQPGDHIQVGSTEGIVKDVSWRQTVVVDYEHNVHLIPNAVISSTEVIQIDPSFIVTSTVVLNNDGRDIDEMLGQMEALAKQAVERVAELERDPWILVTQIGEYGIWTKLRFVLKDVTNAREARDAALRAISPYTRNSSDEMLPASGESQTAAEPQPVVEPEDDAE